MSSVWIFFPTALYRSRCELTTECTLRCDNVGIGDVGFRIPEPFDVATAADRVRRRAVGPGLYLWFVHTFPRRYSTLSFSYTKCTVMCLTIVLIHDNVITYY